MNINSMVPKLISILSVVLLPAFLSTGLMAGELRLIDVAADGGAGIDYRRVRSVRDELYDLIRVDSAPAGGVFQRVPTKSRGIPGVAVLDFDNDGDEDIYVTNGPGQANSLFANQLAQTGEMTFIDVGESSGAGAIAQDSSGVCFGDIDNDGDHDIYVLGTGEDNVMLRNNGDGTFTDITEHAGLGAEGRWSSSATMGDVNGDGLLDIYVGNLGFLNSSEILFTVPWDHNEHNQLFLNMGGNRFRDISEESGILNYAGFAPEDTGRPGATHAVAMADYDMDGDIDIFVADDQAGIAPAAYEGVDRGMIHIFQNDGSGSFTDVSVEANASHPGAWMGISFGDYNSDGHLDFFATNMGVYNMAPDEVWERNLDQNSSRWYLAAGDGTFYRPSLENVVATPFGWGTSGFDYDNDGDTDITFYGGIDLVGVIMLTNPGVILENRGDANFEYDADALSLSTNHLRRVVNGVAIGDLNRDGFADIVSASNFNVQESVPLSLFADRDGAFDGVSSFVPTFGRYGDPETFRYNPDLPDFEDGTLSVEINSGDNGNGSVWVRLVGGKGVTSLGKVNRDAIGAVVTFWPYGGDKVMMPVQGGSSYASQDSMEIGFGLGQAESGTLEVLWPGGIKTRLYGVKAGERLVIPELPVSYENGMNFSDYSYKIEEALEGMVELGYISAEHAFRIKDSARMAYLLEHCPF